MVILMFLAPYNTEISPVYVVWQQIISSRKATCILLPDKLWAYLFRICSIWVYFNYKIWDPLTCVYVNITFLFTFSFSSHLFPCFFHLIDFFRIAALFLWYVWENNIQ